MILSQRQSIILNLDSSCFLDCLNDHNAKIIQMLIASNLTHLALLPLKLHSAIKVTFSYSQSYSYELSSFLRKEKYGA